MQSITFKEAAELLAAAGITNAKNEICLLAEHFLNIGRSELLISSYTQKTDDPDFIDALKRRADREPLQYIISEWDFYGLRFMVNPDVLIPRSDTELIVEEAIRTLPAAASVVDLCTGSGCIAIAVAVNRRDCSFTALDISKKALKTAEENAALNGVGDRIDFVAADIRETSAYSMLSRADMIISNPPYIKNEVISTLQPEVAMEPVLALDGGTDGLDFYRAILSNAGRCLKTNGRILFEIGYDQANDIKDLALHYGYTSAIKKDYSGNDRMAVLSKLTVQGRSDEKTDGHKHE